MLILVRSIGVLILLVLAAVGWMSIGPQVKAPTSTPPDGKCRPTRGGLAMQMAKRVADAYEIVGLPPAPGQPENADRAALRDQQHRDFYFIAAYGLLFLAMSLLLARRPLPGAVWLGLAAGVCAVAAALFDVRENLNVLHFLSLSSPSDADALAIRFAALWKWGLFSATLVPLSALYFGRGHWGLTVIGGIFLLTAGLGFAGLACPRLLAATFLTLGAGLLPTMVLCLFYPKLLA